MTKSIRACLALSVVMLTACAAEKAASEQPIVLRGQLISEATKKPLSGFLVAVGDATPKGSPFGLRGADKFGAGKSDSSGKFVISVSDTAGYRKAEKRGQLALYLTGDAPVVGIVGLKSGDSPVYLVPSIPSISSPSQQ